MIYRLILFSSLFFLVSCSGSASSAAGHKAGEEYPYPSIPESIRDPQERAQYLSLHYWDAMDFADPAIAQDTLYIEQAFSNFIDILPYVADRLAIDRAMDRLVAGASASASVYSLMLTTAEKYLYDLESPFRNDDAYAAFLRQAIASDATNMADRMRLEDKLREIEMCQPGSMAPDFKAVGGPSLSDIGIGKEKVVIFYDPECASCRRAIGMMSELPLLQGGSMAVVAVCTDDQAQPIQLHDGWHSLIADPDCYVTRNLPSVYVIGNDGRIKLKDASVEQFLYFLQGQAQ